MTDPISIGIIGCGFFARNHLHSWKDLAAEGADLVAVCDVDAAKAQSGGRGFGVPHWYTDAETMFRERKLGLVDIITRMDTHRQLAEMAARYKVPMIVQKPFAPDIEAVRAIVDTAERAGCSSPCTKTSASRRRWKRSRSCSTRRDRRARPWARISFRTGYDIYKGQPYFSTRSASSSSISACTWLTWRASSWRGRARFLRDAAPQSQGQGGGHRHHADAPYLRGGLCGGMHVRDSKAARPVPRNAAGDRRAARRNRDPARLSQWRSRSMAR
jgi:hypothetical protein